jgi:hypothetical protein
MLKFLILTKIENMNEVYYCAKSIAELKAKIEALPKLEIKARGIKTHNISIVYRDEVLALFDDFDKNACNNCNCPEV